MSRPFHTFTAADHAIWSELYHRQWANAARHAVTLWTDGVRALDLTADRIPDFARLSDRIHALTGWTLVSTPVQYSSGQDWFEALARREFLITEYIRDADSLDYTPLPDIWHDAFGHLPFLADQRYVDYLERFAQTAVRYTPDERKSLGSLWWYTIEFGLMREGDDLRAFGAGLMSSVAELQRAYSAEVTRRPYTLEAFESLAPSPHHMHNTLFILDSFEQVESALAEWTAAHPAGVPA